MGLGDYENLGTSRELNTGQKSDSNSLTFIYNPSKFDYDWGTYLRERLSEHGGK